jgi:hydrogenase expression/formation protein HypE
MTARTSRLAASRLAMSTDSYVVRPMFFPGGDIGTLAVNGTVNDLAMCGARPMFLSAGFVIEEGLPIESLHRIVRSMQAAARAAGVTIVTGDTKVVDRGKGDGVYVNTAGVGAIEHDLFIAPASVRAGDTVLLSGDIGRHGMAVMAARENLQFESAIESDCAPLAAPVLALLDAGSRRALPSAISPAAAGQRRVEIAESTGLHIRSTRRRFRFARTSAAPARFSVSIRSTSPTRGRFMAFIPPADAGPCARRAPPLRGQRRGRDHRHGVGSAGGPGDDEEPDRRDADRRHVERRAIAEDLLSEVTAGSVARR